jgi:AcrR family transcriptional regulator
MKSRRNSPAAARAYHHGNLQAALVEAGLAALGRMEHQDLSLRELAREVGVSANAAYRHFADREALLAAIAAEGFRKVGAVGAKARSGQKTPLDAVRATGYAYIQFARRNAALFKLMFKHFDEQHRSAALDLAARQALETIYVDVASALRLEPGDPRVTLVTLHAWSHVHGLGMLILEGQLDRVPVDLDQLIGMVARGYRFPELPPASAGAARASLKAAAPSPRPRAAPAR